MKRLMIAAAAIALMGSGMAMAQQTSTPDTSNAQHGASDMGGTLPQPAPGAQQDANSAAASGAGSTMSPGASSGTTAMASNTGAMVGDETSTNPAPSSYPHCTHKGQDRCKTKGG